MPQPPNPDSRQVQELLDEAYKIRINNLSGSLSMANKALSLSRSLNEIPLIAQCLSKLSLFNMIVGEYDLAIKQGKEGSELFEKLKDQKGIADVKYNIAGVLYKTDNYHQALIYLIDCLEIFETLNDYHNQARVYKSLGTIYEFFGDEKSAVLSYEKSIAAAQSVNDKNLQSNVYNPLSGIYVNRGDLKKAWELINRSIMLKDQTGDIRGMAFALYGKAKIYAKEEKFELAEKVFLESSKIHEEMGERLGLGMCYYKLGSLYIKMGLLDKAITELEFGLDFAYKNNIAMIKFKCCYLMYEAFKLKEDSIAALKYLEIYLREKEAVINTQTQKVIESYEALSKMERLKKEAEMQHEKAEILEKKNRAEEATRVKQEFLSTMSHEIRTPLNAVITITSLMEEKPDPKDGEELLQSLKFSANNLLRIINDILDFSKLDAGKAVLEPSSNDFLVLLENISNTYQTLAKEKGISLSLKIDKKISQHYLFDQTKLTQILGNLVSNAIKFTEKGEIKISVKFVKRLSNCDQLEISVKDSGLGISEEFLREIFESFSQPKSFTTKKHRGSGLGLAIVKKLIELHGSSINVESEVGNGSRFYFDINLPIGAPTVSSKTLIPDKIIGKTVLLAEDNMINAMVSTKLLSNWGLRVIHAKDGQEAVNFANQDKVDVILMDIHMPEMDGFSATKLIRTNDGINSTTPIFALTADITANQKEMFSPFFDGFLLKPIEIEKLYRALLNSWSHETHSS